MGSQYSYSLDGFGTMSIWEDDCLLCTMSDCYESDCEQLFEDVVFEMRGIAL